MLMETTVRRDLLTIFQAALKRVNGAEAVRLALAGASSDVAPIHLIAIGKAAAAMTRGALAVWGDLITSGLVITKHGHLDGLDDERLRLIESDHPVPGAASLEAGRALTGYCRNVPEQARLVALISGGASSLVEVLPADFSLEDLRALTTILLGSGLDITAINRIRQEVSQIKGGKLLRYLAAGDIRVLLISDVPGDDPAMIGSGLFYPVTHRSEVVWPPAALVYKAKLPVAVRLPENRVCPPHKIIANLDAAKQAAAARARDMGYSTHIHEEFLQGDVVQVAGELGGYLQTAAEGLHIWGGETAVTLPEQPGRGGRNQHLGLCLARRLQGNDSVTVLTAGTDGTDGPTDDAGALVDGGTIERGDLAGFNADATLDAFDAGTFLQASGDLVTTGPTGTNVMDLVLALVTPKQ